MNLLNNVWLRPQYDMKEVAKYEEIKFTDWTIVSMRDSSFEESDSGKKDRSSFVPRDVYL